jgi:hypothetical protein
MANRDAIATSTVSGTTHWFKNSDTISSRSVGIGTESHKEVQLAEKGTQVVFFALRTLFNFSISVTLSIYSLQRGKQLLAGGNPTFSP